MKKAGFGFGFGGINLGRKYDDGVVENVFLARFENVAHFFQSFYKC